MLVFEFQVLAEIDLVTEGDETHEVFNDLSPSNYDQTARILIDVKSEDSMNYAMLKLRYAGFDGESFNDLDLEGRDIRCVNSPAPYKGKERDQWDLALPRQKTNRPSSAIDGKMARKLDAFFGKRLKTSKIRSGIEAGGACDGSTSRR